MFRRTVVIGYIAFSTITLAAPIKANAKALDTFGVLAGSTITNVPASGTTINGNVDLSPGSAITGFEINTVTPPYAIYQTDAVAAQAQLNLTSAYYTLAGQSGNHRRLLEPIGNIPPAEAEEQFYAMLDEPALAA